MKIKIIVFLLAFLLFSLSKLLVYAGTTGKIAGQVTDAETGEPLIGVNIVVEGSQLGAATDTDGTYVILNIAPGAYTLEVSMMGYQQVQFKNVQVNIDLTTRLDASLKPMTLELGETVVVEAQRELIVKDMTSSLSTMSADQIKNLPVQAVQEVLRLNAGIIEANGRLHIRGGRAGEVAYWVDGVAATDVYDGRIGTRVENSAVQEMQVISGTFNAEYGQAMSGIINIITKEGGKDYHGQVKVYGGDYVSNADEFKIYKKLKTEADPTTGLTRIVSGDRENPLTKFNPTRNGEVSLGGPVPLLGKKVTFFTNARYYFNEGYYYGRAWYKPNGTPGDSSLVALNPYESITAQGKLTYRLSSKIKLNYNLFWNKSDRERNFNRFGALADGSPDYNYNTSGQAGFSQFTSHDYKYVPNGIPQYHLEGFTHTFTLNHVLSHSTFYELRLGRYYSESKQYVYEDPTQGVKYLVAILDDDGNQIDVFDYTAPGGQAKLDSVIAAGARWEYVVDPNGPDGYIDPDDINPPTSYSFMNRGMDITHTTRSTSYWVGKVDLTSQMTSHHQIKVGSEVRLHELELHGFQIIEKTDPATGQVIEPFQPAVPEVGSIYRHDYNRKPREISAYIQDKIEFNNIILNVGLRYDYFDANSVVPTDLSDPNIYDPFKNENKYANWTPPPPNYSGTLPGYIDSLLTVGAIREYTPDERRKFMQKKVDPKMSLSPRIGIAFPITARGVIHFSYGHFLQIPEFQYLYTNPDFKVSSGSGTAVFGNPDLEPQKTVMYELGLQQQLTDNIGVDVTLFYRDVRDWVGTSESKSTAKTAVVYTMFENKDYSNVRGVTLKLEKRFANNYSFRADYTFQSAEGTYSNPQDAFNAALRNQAPNLSLIPMGWDQRHTFNTQVIYSLSNWTFSLIGRYWSGRPYTPTFPQSDRVGSSAYSGLRTNSARRQAQKAVDLTINKAFKLFSNIDLEFFVYVYNLFDERDQTYIYTDTGSADYTTTIDPTEIPYSANRVSTVEDFINQPSWYTAPRQVQFGVILGF
jgi:outer membrane receptor for ferrienterochelin and colicin